MSGEGQNSGAGATAKAAAPVVFWDGYGLDQAASGVSVHARSLAEAWTAPFLPVVVAPLGTRRAGEVGRFALEELPDTRVSAKLGRLKPVWPGRVARFVDEAVHKARLSPTEPVILHGLSNFNLPLSAGPAARLRTVVTVHDLIPLLRPDCVSDALALQLRFLMPRVLRRADRIVCVSEWTRRTLGELFPDAAAKAVVIPNGRLPAAAAKPARAVPRTVLQALSVGRSEPYKRHDFLVELLRGTSLPLSLTLVTDAAGAAALSRGAADLLAAGKLKVLSAVPTPRLRQLYAEADVYLQPSELEGYCLPAADALAALTPVVYQAGSGIDEVAGRSVGYPLPPGASVGAWAEAAEAAAAAGKAPGFPALVQAHLASLVTWEAAAARLAALYRELA